MNWETIIFERFDAVVKITMNRPKEFNALNVKLLEELVEAIELCNDDSIRAVILTGSGNVFCSGGDLAVINKYLNTETQSNFLKAATLTLNELILSMRNLPKPILASINGSTGGAGMSLALACDLRIAAQSAKFKQAYTSVGLSPDGAFTLLAGAVIGLGKLSELVFLDPVITADEAKAIGLIHKVVDDEKLHNETFAWANKLAKGATKSYAKTKFLLNQALLTMLEKQLELERQGIIASSQTKDCQEGIAAFFQKRLPNFENK